MPIHIGVLCSGEGQELTALLEAAQSGRLPLEIKIVITDRDSAALHLSRSAGIYGCFVPRSAFHGNRDGFERRLVEILKESEAEILITAGFLREYGPVLEAAFPYKIIDINGLSPEKLVEHVFEKLKRSGLSLPNN